MKPVCVPCQRFYRIHLTGAYFVENMPKPGVHHALPGTQEPFQWQPYKLWVGDLWKCEGCQAEIIVGVSNQPIAEHYQPDFSQRVERLNATLSINDC